MPMPQLERDTPSMHSATQMHSGNQKSQAIQHTAARQATAYFGNRG